jgi:hypothetical protein
LAGLAGWARGHWGLFAAAAAYAAATGLTAGTVCFVNATTGLPCPGCGSARAFAALLRGDVAEAHRMHPLILLSAAVLAVALLDALAPAARTGLWPWRRLGAKFSPKAIRRALVGLAILYVAVYAARMLLMFPDTPPMSVNENALYRRLYRLAAEMPK